MNALVVMIIGLIWFYLAYRFYGGIIRRRLVSPLDLHKTPAHKYKDSIDFSPGKRIFVWGNHFAAIAGAGPIIGPILAVSIFGWGYTALWITIGTVFIGAAHDYLALILSVRHKGESIAKIAGLLMGNTVRITFSILLLILLVLIVAVFMVSVAQALINVPSLVIPTFGLVIIAILMGLLIEAGFNDIICAITGVVLAYVLIWVGYKVPITLPHTWSPALVSNVWIIILSLYCFIASISPIWLILRPRDFISSMKLMIGVSLGVIGLIVVHPAIHAPFHIGGFFSTNHTPVWPMLFIIVACGAISGFHSIVASGTTSKQLNTEADAQAISFGGMIMEGVLALLVVMIVSAGLFWGNAPKNLPAAQAHFYFGTALAKNWIIAFGEGFGNIVGRIGIPFLTIPLALLIGAVMVKAFILTTLDSCTRLARLILNESFGKKVKICKSRWLMSFLFILPAAFLATTKSYKTIWVLFGSANQLVAAITLTVISIYLLRKKKPTLFTTIPALFMICTTVASLLWGMFNKYNGYFFGPKPEYTVGIIAVVLLLLAFLVMFKGYHKIRCLSKF